MKMKLLGGLLAATTITALGVAILPTINNNVQALTRSTSELVTCENGYQTNFSWNISREEIAELPSYNEDNMIATSEIITAVSYEGYCMRDTTYQSIRIGSGAQGSITFTLTKDIDAIGFYACAYQNDKDTGKSLLVNDIELTKTLPACQTYEYTDTLRFFKTFDSPTNKITIKAKQASNNRFHIYSVGFYSIHNFPNHSGSGGDDPTPIDPSSDSITVKHTMSEIVNTNNYTISSGNTATCYTSFELNNIITISTTGAANCGSFWSSGSNIEWRLYQAKSGNIIITSQIGYIIQSVIITYNISNTGTLKDGNTIIESGSTINVNASSKTFTVGNTGSATNGQVRITQISVTYQANN